MLYIGDTVYVLGKYWLIVNILNKNDAVMYDGDIVHFCNRILYGYSSIQRKNIKFFLDLFCRGKLCIWFHSDNMKDKRYIKDLMVVLGFLEKEKIRIPIDVFIKFSQFTGSACIMTDEYGNVVFERFPKEIVSFPYTKDFFMNDNELYDVGL